ncbi:MAG: hypothetical protein RL059_1512 [Bacteroidota bacterium]
MNLFNFKFPDFSPLFTPAPVGANQIPTLVPTNHNDFSPVENIEVFRMICDYLYCYLILSIFAYLQLRQPILRDPAQKARKVSCCSSCHKPKATECACSRVKFRPIRLDNIETLADIQNDIPETNNQDVALVVDPGSDCEDSDCGDDTAYAEIDTEAYNQDFFNGDDEEDDFIDETNSDTDVEVEVEPDQYQVQDYNIEPSSDRLRQPNMEYQQRRSIPALNLPRGQKPGPSNIPPNINNIPWEFVQLFWTDTIINTFIANTNAYSVNSRRLKWHNITSDELCNFFSLIIYLHNFDLFRGSSQYDQLGKSGCPVLKLTESAIYHNKNHIIWLDNFFQSLNLSTYLRDYRGIQSGGTLQSNRISKHIIDKGWYLKKGTKRNPTAPGTAKCKRLTEITDGVEKHVYITTWFHKRTVNLLSTIPPEIETFASRIKDKAKKTSQITTLARPTLVNWYNKGMGGTDSFDQCISYYRTGVKSKRWPHRIIFHFFLSSVINAHIIYKWNTGIKINLLTFIEELIDTMAAMGVKNNTESDEDEFNINYSVPIKKMRFDTKIEHCDRLVGQHWPVSLPTHNPQTGQHNRRKCAFPICSKIGSVFCKSCHVALCIDDEGGSNCFTKFHTLSQDDLRTMTGRSRNK